MKRLSFHRCPMPQISTRSHASDDPLGLSLAFWLPSLTFLLHTLEEIPEFPLWVSRHFGAMSVLEFSLVHIPLLWLSIWISYSAVASSRPVWRFLAFAFQWQFAFNAVFHLGAAAIFREYAPGMVTAAAVALPATLYVTLAYRRYEVLPGRSALAACAVGGAIAVAAVGSLFG